MKSKNKFIISLILIITLTGSSAAYAGSPSKGMKGSQGEILSKITMYAGTGEFSNINGEAADASFRTPERIAVLFDGSVLVSDSRNHVIRKISDNEVTTYAGFTLEFDEVGLPLGGWNDDVLATSVFNSPAGMSADAAGNVYIADADNHMIRKMGIDGTVTTVAGNGAFGDADGEGEAAEFYYPQDVAVAQDGTLYVADTLNHLIRKITTNGDVTTLNALSDRTVEVAPGVVEFAGDYQDGAIKDAKFNEPTSITIDSKGNLYVSDTGNHLIRYIDLSAGMVSTVAGFIGNSSTLYAENALLANGGYVDGEASEAKFFAPKGTALTGEGGLLIADSLNHTIRYLIDGQVITIAGDLAGDHGNSGGINGYNQLHFPTDVAILPDGNIVIADSYNNLIREFSLYRLPNHLPINEDVKVVLDDEVIIFDNSLELINGRTMIPVRALTEEIGYLVDYDAEGRAVSLTKDDIRIELFIGKAIMTTQLEGMEKVEKEIDIAPYIKEGRTYVPLRFISEEFGLDVQWSQQHKTVILRETVQ